MPVGADRAELAERARKATRLAYELETEARRIGMDLERAAPELEAIGAGAVRVISLAAPALADIARELERSSGR